MKIASYTKVPDGSGFAFSVTPAPKPSLGCAGLMFHTLLAVLGGMLVGAISPNLGLIAGIAIFAYSFLKLDLRKKPHKTPSSFVVMPDAVRFDGQVFRREDIHRINVRNAYDRSPSIQLTGQTVSTGVGIGYDIRNALEQVTYGIQLEAGGKAHLLAGGMDETTAFGLYTEVCKILGFEAK